MSWLWLALLILAAVCAVVTKNGIFISLIPASVLCCILDFLDVKVYIQAIVFVSFTAVLGLLYKFVFSKRGSFSNDALSVDSIVGEKCVVVEKVDNFAGCGLVRVGRQYWSARGAYEDDVFEIGDDLTVVAIEGVKLICKKI